MLIQVQDYFQDMFYTDAEHLTGQGAVFQDCSRYMNMSPREYAKKKQFGQTKEDTDVQL